jgi:hypothetical protein
VVTKVRTAFFLFVAALLVLTFASTLTRPRVDRGDNGRAAPPLTGSDEVAVKLSVWGNYSTARIEQNVRQPREFEVKAPWWEVHEVSRGKVVRLFVGRPGTSAVHCRVERLDGVGEPDQQSSTALAGAACILVVE